MREALGPITFDWANMKLNYSNGYNESEMLAVAQLMQYCGWSVMMEYGTDVSLSGTENIALRLKDTFGFDEGISYKERAEYSDSDWEELIYNELAARRPVAYGGSDAFGVAAMPSSAMATMATVSSTSTGAGPAMPTASIVCRCCTLPATAISSRKNRAPSLAYRAATWPPAPSSRPTTWSANMATATQLPLSRWEQ